MNIFVLDENPAKAAAMLCDCHVRKMCMETSQILSAVMLRRGLALSPEMPKPQSLNHPVIVAADADSDGLDWVLNYNFEIHRQFSIRFGKPHIYAVLAMDYVSSLWSGAYPGDCSRLAMCCGGMQHCGLGIVEAYRMYYKEVKKVGLTEKGLWKFTKAEDWTK